MTLLTYLFILIFLIGLYFYAKTADPAYSEGLTNNTSKNRCPDMLIQKGSRFYLYNSKVAQVPGVNPIEFDNLEDYSEFLNWQRSQNITCPVLYLQQSYDAQGNEVYKSRPSVSEPQGGLPPTTSSSNPGISPPNSSINSPPNSSINPNPNTSNPINQEKTSSASNYPNQTLLVDATRDDPPYNTNSYPAEDPSSYYVGTTTPLDMMDIQQESAKISPNPMDSNWGGTTYTQQLVDSGYYKDNTVSKTPTSS